MLYTILYHLLDEKKRLSCSFGEWYYKEYARKRQAEAGVSKARNMVKYRSRMGGGIFYGCVIYGINP